MRIEWSPPVRPASQRRDDKAAAGDRSFTTALDTEPAATVSVKGATALSPLEGLLSLQEITDGPGGRRRAVARGQKLLDALDGIRHALLVGHVARGDLSALARLAAEAAPSVDDPHLRDILADIELRAAVELAKLDAA